MFIGLHKWLYLWRVGLAAKLEGTDLLLKPMLFSLVLGKLQRTLRFEKEIGATLTIAERKEMENLDFRKVSSESLRLRHGRDWLGVIITSF